MEGNSSTSSFRLVKQILIILLMLFIADFTIGAALRWMFFKSTIGWEPMIIESVQKTEDEIIVFGSSYANSQYDSRIFEEESGMGCYNAAIPGQSLIYATAVQECILSRYTPELFIVDISPKDIIKRDSRPDYLRLNVLLPFVNECDIKDILYKRDKFERYKMVSKIYPFNSMILTFILNWGKEDNFYKGYQPFDTQISQERLDAFFESTYAVELAKTENLKIDSFKMEMLHRFMQNCRDYNTEVVFVVSPKIFEYGAQYLFDYMEKEIEKGGFELIDWKYREDFLHIEEYRDVHHLNRTGATRFTRLLARELKSRGYY